MRQRLRDRARRGAALVEAAVVLGLFFAIVLGMIDLGTAVFRYHLTCQASRQGARLAIVHGALAQTQWGPSTYGPVAANDSSAIAQAIAPYLSGMDPSKATITVQWPDGDNWPGSRAEVTVTTTYQPMMTFLFGSPSWTLSATSTMPIAH
jgi:Flp pilus assembly protein TadG